MRADLEGRPSTYIREEFVPVESKSKPRRYPETFVETQAEFLEALLTGRAQRALELASLVKTTEDIPGFYLNVIQPSLAEIGQRWERSEISVAHEHLATAMCLRIMASLHDRLILRAPRLGRAVVAAAPDELHEIGAWMVADLLLLEGWNVTFLGANNPAAKLIELVEDQRPDLLAVSVTMPSNLEAVASICRSLKSRPAHAGMKIMLGGLAFAGSGLTADQVGADGLAADASAARELSRTWWDQAAGARP